MDSAPPESTGFSLLETMRLEGGRLERLDRHLARMGEAARDFKYAWTEATVRDALATVARDHPEGSWRVRLLLSHEGQPAVECTPYAAETRAWRVDFARDPIDPLDPFILHK